MSWGTRELLQSTAALALIVAGNTGVALAQEAGKSEEPANSVDESDEGEKVIVVTGIVASLTESASIKRNASGVVDAISAEDIGKFPDTNLAESLQRITGVSIDRENNEGSKITVRGFGPRFNLVLLNGRSMPTSAALNGVPLDRSFNFQNLASESVAGVDVYKTSRADLPTGGIGSTVNIRSAKPFDYSGTRAVFGVKGIVDRSNVTGDDVTPQISGLYSTRLLDDRLGILVGGSYSKRDSRQEQVQISGYQRSTPATAAALAARLDLTANENPDDIFYLPRNLILKVGDTTRERVNAQAVLQFEPVDDLVIGLDYHGVRYKENQLSNQTSFWYCFCANRRTGPSDENGLVDLTGTGEDVDFFGFNQILEDKNDSFGATVDWQVSDAFSLSLDAHRSIAESQPDGDIAEVLTNFRSQPGVTGTILFTDNDIPDLVLDFNGVDVYNQSLLIPDIGQQRGNLVKNTIEEIKLVANYDNGGRFIESFNWGAAFSKFKYDSRSVATGNVSLAGIDPNDLDITFVDRGSVGSNFSGGNGLFPMLGIYDPRQAIQLAFDAGALSVPEPRQNIVREETFSAFANLNLAADFGSVPFEGRLGVRYERSDVEASSRQQLIQGLRYFSTSELNVVRSQAQSFESITGSYEYVLPSIDLRIEPFRDVVLRASYGHSLTRSPLNLLAPETAILQIRPGDQESGIFQARQGNADLSPALAKNIDLSAEWYFKKASYFSLGYFRKKVSAFTRGSTTLQPLLDENGNPLTNPSANPRPGCPSATDPICFGNSSDPVVQWQVSRLSNSDAVGTVQGFEANFQYTFDFGLGFIANYTHVTGDIRFDLDNFFQQEPAPLTGLSDSANLVLFYEKGPIQARIAYNWRDEFLVAVGAGPDPIFVDPYQQIDFSASYKFNDRFSVFVEGINITNEINRSHWRSQRQLSSATSGGPRYGFGVRVKL